MSDLFTVCFGFGAAASILTFGLGIGRHGALHVPHLGHLGSGGSISSHGGVSPLNLSSILSFLVVFGAVGLVMQGGFGWLIVLVVAALAGLAAGWLSFIFLARFLVRGQTFLVDEPIAGTMGTVSAAISAGRIGEVIYTRNGVRRSDGARSIDGTPILAGEEVVIVSSTNGIATVQRWREFFNTSPRVAGQSPTDSGGGRAEVDRSRKG